MFPLVSETSILSSVVPAGIEVNFAPEPVIVPNNVVLIVSVLPITVVFEPLPYDGDPITIWLTWSIAPG